MSVILALASLRQEDLELEHSLGCIARHCLKKHKAKSCSMGQEVEHLPCKCKAALHSNSIPPKQQKQNS
jgi:hypothetical protein